MQLYLIFQPSYKTVTTFSGLPFTISECDSKRLSNEKFKSFYTASKSISPQLLWIKSRIALRFEGSCLKQEDTVPFTPNIVVNLFIVYELDRWCLDRFEHWFYSKRLFFGAIRLTKDANPDK